MSAGTITADEQSAWKLHFRVEDKANFQTYCRIRSGVIFVALTTICAVGLHFGSCHMPIGTALLPAGVCGLLAGTIVDALSCYEDPDTYPQVDAAWLARYRQSLTAPPAAAAQPHTATAS